MKDIFIIGAGGVGRETAQLIMDINSVNYEWNILGFIDDNESLHGDIINGYKVLGGISYINQYDKPFFCICTISDPRIKEKVISRISNPNASFAVLIHPSAIIASTAKIGADVIIQAYCIVSTNTIIEDHVQLNPQCGIGHDSMIGEYSSLYWNVNISGNVKLEKGCLIGTKATVIQNKKIGRFSIIGANATVVSNIPEYCTAVGVPAKPIKYHRED